MRELGSPDLVCQRTLSEWNDHCTSFSAPIMKPVELPTTVRKRQEVLQTGFVCTDNCSSLQTSTL
jgi:hypothetical protein